jgi:hypothetical protein
MYFIDYINFPTVLAFLLEGVNVPVEEAMAFSYSMSKGDLFKWLKSKGINERDNKTLFGKIDKIKMLPISY